MREKQFFEKFHMIIFQKHCPPRCLVSVSDHMETSVRVRIGIVVHNKEETSIENIWSGEIEFSGIRSEDRHQNSVRILEFHLESFAP